MNLLMFFLKDVRYAIDVLEVEEVIPLPAITPLAKLPSFVRGIINLRGTVVPIIDLRERLGFGSCEYDLNNDVIIVKFQEKRAGFVVDDVLSVEEIQDDLLIPPPHTDNGIDIYYMSGAAKFNSDLVIVFDVSNILTAEEKRELADVPSQKK